MHTVVVGTIAEPRTLLPPLARDLVAGQVCDLVYQRLAAPVPGFSTRGDRGYRGDLATSWAWAPDSLSIRFQLDPAARWHDGHAVTSQDVRFTYALLRAPGVVQGDDGVRRLVDSVTAPGPHVVVVWLRRRDPSAFHRLVYAARILPAHRLATVPVEALDAHPLNRAPIGSGPYRVAGWEPGIAVRLRRVGADVPSRPGSGPHHVVFRFAPDYAAAFAAVASGETDVADFLRPEDVHRLKVERGLSVLQLPGFAYATLQFNLRRPAAGSRAFSAAGGRPRPPGPHPLFGDVRLRRALAMGVDRAGLTANLLGELGHISPGPVTRGQQTFDSTLRKLPYDPAGAGRLLDSLGWRVRALDSRVRERDGQALRFTLLVPSSSATRVRAAVLLQAMLARLGVDVVVDRRDNAAVVEALEAGAFDATLVAVRVDPDPGAIREAWGASAGRAGTGFNFGGYDDPATDTLIDRADAVRGELPARVAYHAAYQRIVDAVPALFLYEPTALVVVSRRVRPTGMRDDAWWADLAHWDIAPPAARGKREVASRPRNTPRNTPREPPL